MDWLHEELREVAEQNGETVESLMEIVSGERRRKAEVQLAAVRERMVRESRRSQLRSPSGVLSAILVGILLFTSSVPALAVNGMVPVYKKEKWLKPSGEKTKEIEVRIAFEEDVAIVTNRKKKEKDRVEFFRLPYKSIEGMTYSKSKSPRWKTAGGAAVAVGVFAVPLFFMKGKKHWLMIRADGEMTVLRLDKKTFQFVLAEFETKTGVTVSRIEED